MPVCSYLVYPRTGRKEKLISHFNNFSECEALESLNEDIVVLVTDTKDEVEEGILQENLKLIPEIQEMALVYVQEG